MTSKRRWGSLALVSVVLGSIGCAGSISGPPTSRTEGPSRRAAAPKFSSAEEAEAALLALEDRRAFEESVLSVAAEFPDPGVRARAALAVGRIGDVRGATLLRQLLLDRSGSVRAAAAFGCQVLGDPALTSDLIALLKDSDAALVVAAAKAVGFLGRGDGQDALVAAIPGAAAPEPRASMLEALWRFQTPASEAAALPYAADPDAGVRRAALYCLSRKPQEGSLSALTAALSDSDPHAAAMAARALGVLGKKESIEPLAASLDSGRAPVMINALVALEAILEKNPGASVAPDRRARILTLAGDANPNLAVPALVLLRQFEAVDREVRRRLWSIATTGEGRRRHVALQSVVAALREKADKALEAAIASVDAPLRAAAADSLLFLPQAAAKPYLERLTVDRHPLVRTTAISSLRTPEAVKENRPLVNSALTDGDPGVRAAAIEALGLLNDAAVLPILIEAVAKSAAETSPDVPIAAIAVAERLRADPGARAVVDSASRHPKALVSRLARRALLRSFKADASSLAAAEYRPERTAADYSGLLAEAKKPWQARVETTRGEFTIRLAGPAAPLTVLNFVRLARAKFFDGVAIHRVVPNFVLQDGDPTGTGNGSPGYEIRDEINPLEYGRGTVGMALAGPDTGGSQWFVTHSPQPHLNGIYTVFGQVVAGQDVVERLEQWDRIVRVTIAESP